MKESADKEASGHEGDLGGLPLVEEAVAFGGLLQGRRWLKTKLPLSLPAFCRARTSPIQRGTLARALLRVIPRLKAGSQG